MERRSGGVRTGVKKVLKHPTCRHPGKGRRPKPSGLTLALHCRDPVEDPTSRGIASGLASRGGAIGLANHGITSRRWLMTGFLEELERMRSRASSHTPQVPTARNPGT